MKHDNLDGTWLALGALALAGAAGVARGSRAEAFGDLESRLANYHAVEDSEPGVINVWLQPIPPLEQPDLHSDLFQVAIWEIDKHAGDDWMPVFLDGKPVGRVTVKTARALYEGPRHGRRLSDGHYGSGAVDTGARTYEQRIRALARPTLAALSVGEPDADTVRYHMDRWGTTEAQAREGILVDIEVYRQSPAFYDGLIGSGAKAKPPGGGWERVDKFGGFRKKHRPHQNWSYWYPDLASAKRALVHHGFVLEKMRREAAAWRAENPKASRATGFRLLPKERHDAVALTHRRHVRGVQRFIESSGESSGSRAVDLDAIIAQIKRGEQRGAISPGTAQDVRATAGPRPALLVFHATTRGGKYQIRVTEAGRDEVGKHHEYGVMLYSIQWLTSGRSSGGGSSYDREQVVQRLRQDIEGARQIDGINYIVKLDDLGV